MQINNTKYLNIKKKSVLNAVKQLEVRTSQQVFSGSRTSAESDGGSAAAQSDHKQVVGVLQSFQDDLGVLCAEMGSVAGRSPSPALGLSSQSLNQNEVFFYAGQALGS